MALIKSIFWEQENPDELVYKFPSHEITLGSVLTVNESQEAYFFKNGMLYDRFTAGRHTLTSANLPLLNKVVNLPSGGETTFMAEVWFISKTDRRNLYWGTGGLRVIDPYFEIPLKLYGRGGYGVRIDDGALFLKKLVGTMREASLELVEEQFRMSVAEAVKVTIAKFMKQEGLNVNELGTEYLSLGKAVSKVLCETFGEYGVQLLNFNIEEINFDEDDPGYQKVLDGIAEMTRLKKLGVSYVQDRNIDIAQAAASNQGMGAVMGIGMGMGVGQSLGQVVSSSIQNAGLAAPPPPPTAPLNYYVAQNGQTTGPFNEEKLRELINSGILTKETYVFKVGGTAWVKAESDASVMQLFPMMPPPPPPAM